MGARGSPPINRVAITEIVLPLYFFAILLTAPIKYLCKLLTGKPIKAVSSIYSCQVLLDKTIKGVSNIYPCQVPLDKTIKAVSSIHPCQVPLDKTIKGVSNIYSCQVPLDKIIKGVSNIYSCQVPLDTAVKGVSSCTLSAKADNVVFNFGITTSGGLFGVTADGVLTAKSGTIGGLTLSENSISASNGLFSVNSDGYLTANSGKIGGFTIGSSALYNGINSMTASGTGVYLGTDGLNLGGNFTVGKDGTVLIKKGAMQIGKEESDHLYTLNLDEQYIVFNRKLTDFSSSQVTELSAGRLEYNAVNGTDKAHGGICMSHEGSIALNTAPHTVVWGYPQLKLKATSSEDSEGDSGRNDTGAYIMLYNSGSIRIAARSGGSGTLEGTWYYSGSPIEPSDKKIKNSIDELDDRYSLLFDNLKPVRYKYTAGTSDRYHTGLVAQDVKNAIEQAGLSTKDVAAYAEWEADSHDEASCGIRYEELIPLCIAEIQKLKKLLQVISQ